MTKRRYGRVAEATFDLEVPHGRQSHDSIGCDEWLL